MDIAIPLYDGFTSLDVVGPYEVLWRVPGARVAFLAAEPGTLLSDRRALSLRAELALNELPHPDVIMVPGGRGSRALLDDETMLGWLREAHEHAQWTTSVCTGSLLLGAAGILQGLEAATHWLQRDTLARFGALPSTRRVVEQGKVITAAGVSAGIDMALLLAARLAGDEVAQEIQLSIEYDPEPPFDAGSPERAPAELVERLRARAASKP